MSRGDRCPRGSYCQSGRRALYISFFVKFASVWWRGSAAELLGTDGIVGGATFQLHNVSVSLALPPPYAPC